MTEEEKIIEIREPWMEKARAAGWAPMPKTRLRGIECQHPFGDTCGPECSRPLTQEELKEVAENIFRNARVDTITLPSGLKVILVEGEDAKG